MMTPSGHNWVAGQGAGPRLANKEDDEEEKFDAMVSDLLLTCRRYRPAFPVCNTHC